MKYSIRGLMLVGISLVSLSVPASAARRDQKFALEGIATFAPIEPQDLRFGFGVDIRPAHKNYFRVDAVQHQVGVTINRRFKLADTLRLSAGIGGYYDFTKTGNFLQHIVPQVTLGHLTF